MDQVQAFIARNQHQFGYIMQEASRQWKTKDPIGALTVGPCNLFVEKYGDYHEMQDKKEIAEKQWELLKLELKNLEEFYERTDDTNELHVIHDIQSLISKIETGEY
ncbi:hypothetical protein MKY20_11340 [Cytobacillus sp. FSL W8-0315]|uniref:hypothetical protein n=1 Tax=Cytobacillus sp. FSL W8-0315 TaxID=2921600 RepID=UPI0030F4E938